MSSSPISVDLLPHFDFDHFYAHGWISPYWLLLPPFHLSGIIPIQMYRVFCPPIFSKCFFFSDFPSISSIFGPFPPCSASQHPAAGKEHSGGLWLTNLCSQKCLWAMGSPPTWLESGSHYGWVCLKIGVPQNEWFLWMENHIKFGLCSMDETDETHYFRKIEVFLFSMDEFGGFLTWHHHFKGKPPEAFSSLGNSSRNWGFPTAMFGY